MGYIEQTLTPGEQVLHRTRLHWVVVVGQLLLALVFLVAAIACVVMWFRSDELQSGDRRPVWLWLAALTVIGAGIAFVAGLARRAGVEMAVTNRRLIVKTGVLRRHTIEMMLSKIESISVSQGVLGRIANYGDVMVRGSGGTAEHFPRIADPLRLRMKAQEQIERSHGASAMPASTAEILATPNRADYAPPGGAPAQRFCGKCGADLPPEVEFCPRCGTRRMR